MDKLTLHASADRDMTMVSNIFLDDYMPSANGEFVKIYLLLLRLQARKEASLSLSFLADRLNLTETDVLRAIRYWEKEGLLLLETNEDGELCGIMFASPSEKASSPVSRTMSLTPETHEETLMTPGKVSTERKNELMQDEELQQVFFIIERYMERPLTSTEYLKVLYYYDVMHFSVDMIEFLFEYCVDNGHKSFHYIDKVACNWFNGGIRTVHEARASITRYNKDYFQILKAFGITGRNPIDSEITYMKKWLETWAMPEELIREACTRTVMSTGNASFNYADSILQRWHKAGVGNLTDLSELDKQHEEERSRTGGKRAAGRGSARPANTSAFSYSGQRKYKLEDLDNIEKQLLKGKRDGTEKFPV